MADTNSLYTCTPRQAAQYIERILYAGLVPYIKGSPGTAKSTIGRNVAKKLRLKLIDHRLSTSDPTDMSGLPRFDDNGYASFAPFAELFPLEDTPIPEGYDGWLIFFDEYNAAPKQVRAACFKVLLDRMVGQHKLHPNVCIMMAGNLDTDRSITSTISTAEQSRVIHLKMDATSDQYFKEFNEDVLIGQEWDWRTRAYLNQFPSKLMDFKPDHEDATFCCPRTWEFLDKLIQGQEVDDSFMTILAGTITSNVAVEFVQYCQVYKDLITVPQILRDPKGCTVPYEANLKWATISSMMEKITDDNFEDLATYANRFSMDFRVLFYRSIMIRKETKHLRHHPAFGKGAVALAKYLND